jgi:hypothetical protein
VSAQFLFDLRNFVRRKPQIHRTGDAVVSNAINANHARSSSAIS